MDATSGGYENRNIVKFGDFITNRNASSIERDGDEPVISGVALTIVYYSGKYRNNK